MPAAPYDDLRGKPTTNTTLDQIPELQQYLASQTQGTQNTQPNHRRVWPWVVVLLVGLLILIVAIFAIAAMISPG